VIRRLECPWCGNLMKKETVKHIHLCSRRPLAWSNERRRLEFIKNDTGLPLSKKFVHHHYVELEWGFREFRKELGLAFSELKFLLRYFGVKGRSIKDANSLRKTKVMREKTCIAKFGVPNASQAEIIKEKKRHTFIKNYGVDNIFKAREFIDWLPGEMRARYGKGSLSGGREWLRNRWRTMPLEERAEIWRKAREGSRRWWARLTPSERSQEILKRISKVVHHYNSRLEKRIRRILGSLKIKFIPQFFVTRKSFDFLIVGTKLLIEVNGDFWHANPEVYKAEDTLSFPQGKILAKDIWLRDIKKCNTARRYGFGVMVLWEGDINRSCDKEIGKKILKEIRTHRHWMRKAIKVNGLKAGSTNEVR